MVIPEFKNTSQHDTQLADSRVLQPTADYESYWYWYWYLNSLALIRLRPERGAPAGTPLHDWVLTPRHETMPRPFSSLEVGSEGIS